MSSELRSDSFRSSARRSWSLTSSPSHPSVRRPPSARFHVHIRVPRISLHIILRAFPPSSPTCPPFPCLCLHPLSPSLIRLLHRASLLLLSPSSLPLPPSLVGLPSRQADHQADCLLSVPPHLLGLVLQRSGPPLGLLLPSVLKRGSPACGAIRRRRSAFPLCRGPSWVLVYQL